MGKEDAVLRLRTTVIHELVLVHEDIDVIDTEIPIGIHKSRRESMLQEMLLTESKLPVSDTLRAYVADHLTSFPCGVGLELAGAWRAKREEKLDNSQDCGGECHADCDPYPACDPGEEK